MKCSCNTSSVILHPSSPLIWLLFWLTCCARLSCPVGRSGLEGEEDEEAFGIEWIALDPARSSSAPSDWVASSPCGPPRVQHRGVDFGCLRSLSRSFPRDPEDVTLRFGLLNARSVASKTFLLNYLFTTRELDFMLLTETWLQAGESAPFSELLPPGCCYLNSPRTTGRGGGLATVFKESYICKHVLTDSFSSFELHTFSLGLDTLIFCALVYRPPKFNKDFIKEFTDFLTGLALNHDKFLIVGDFNIHVCCESKPLAKDFLNLIDSFNLIQSVSGSMRKDTPWT
ncbi:hypothetical protein WMY93_033197 [Mugilogobius chulae]|uniref:Endonuclease/exonuclease/phosphatase domain-containing protein n=1 Tax=Mugilogobius chulae TaxID=88201 RepID=A0AAW0MNK5_9GOBI